MKKFELYSDKTGRDHFIDFIKGVAILGVIWLHCMPLQDRMLAPLWCGMSVSIFLLVQVFHSYRKGVDVSSFPNVWKITKRIVAPMLAVTAILASLHYSLGCVHNSGDIWSTLRAGGYGPGSYYPWIYIQFAFLLPLIGKLRKKLSVGHWGGVIFLVSIALEVISSVAGMPEWLWRLLFFRYFLLVYLGYDLVKNGIRLSPWLIMLSFFSIVFIVTMHYLNPDLSPLFIHNGWKVEHWAAYFYPAYLLLWIIRWVYEQLSNAIRLMFEKIGKASYEIFLCQMCYFAIAAPSRIPFFENSKMNYLAYLLLAWLVSVGGGMIWNAIKIKINDRKINYKNA